MDKKKLFNSRADFFNDIVDNITRLPQKIDKILNQDIYYINPISIDILNDPINGDLAIPFKGEFHNKQFEVMYTIWQIGENLRIGIALHDETLQDMFELDAHNEVESIWNGNRPTVEASHGYLFYDWFFETPDLYNSYTHQERFIQGIRHMHFRVMKIIHDKCEMISLMARQSALNSTLNPYFEHDKLLDDNG